jgi:hypothetical protein
MQFSIGAADLGSVVSFAEKEEKLPFRIFKN